MNEQKIIEKTIKFFHENFYVGVDDWGDTVVICDICKNIDEVVEEYKKFLNK